MPSDILPVLNSEALATNFKTEKSDHSWRWRNHHNDNEVNSLATAGPNPWSNAQQDSSLAVPTVSTQPTSPAVLVPVVLDPKYAIPSAARSTWHLTGAHRATRKRKIKNCLGTSYGERRWFVVIPRFTIDKTLICSLRKKCHRKRHSSYVRPGWKCRLWGAEHASEWDES